MAFSFQIDSREALISFGWRLGEVALAYHARTGHPLVVALDSPAVATGKTLIVLGAGLVIEPEAYLPADKSLPVDLDVNVLFCPLTFRTALRPGQRLVFNDLFECDPLPTSGPGPWFARIVEDRRRAYPRAIVIALANLEDPLVGYNMKRDSTSPLDISIRVMKEGEPFRRRIEVSANEPALERALKKGLMSRLGDCLHTGRGKLDDIFHPPRKRELIKGCHL